MTMKIRQRSRIAPDVHHLRPLSTYSSPSRSIRSWTLVASELATSGSVIANAERISPVEQRLQPPLLLLVGAELASAPPCCPVSGAAQFTASGPSRLRPVISASGAYST